MSKQTDMACQVPIIENPSSQNDASPADRVKERSEFSTRQKNIAIPMVSINAEASSSTSSSSSSSSTSGSPNMQSRISSLNLDGPSTSGSSEDTRVVDKDLEKSDSSSYDGSGPTVAELAGTADQDPFAREGEGGVQYRTMAWW